MKTVIVRECRKHGETEFIGWLRKDGVLNPHCVRCERERATRRRQIMKRISDEIKVYYGCNNCGYNKHACGLEWAHIDPGMKKLTIGNASSVSDFKKELPKCMVLCATCHLEYDNGLLIDLLPRKISLDKIQGLFEEYWYA